jgi:hypothetical protein
LRTARPRPKLILTEEEEKLQEEFVSAFKKDHDKLTSSDLLMLDLASFQYILALRLADSDIRNSIQTGRFAPTSEASSEGNFAQDCLTHPLVSTSITMEVNTSHDYK